MRLNRKMLMVRKKILMVRILLVSISISMMSVSMKDGLVKLLSRDHLGHGISVRMNQDGIELDFHVIISYGVSISAVAANLVENVKYKVESFTGMEVSKINIYVESVKVID